jgi:outer membrane murein-binding lipoprotein Lpp
MVKKLSALALAGLLAMPIAASAGAGGGSGDLAAKIDQLSRELNALKAEMNSMKEEN